MEVNAAVVKSNTRPDENPAEREEYILRFGKTYTERR